MYAVIAVTTMFLLVGTLPIYGAVLFAPFILGLFVLALVGLLGQVSDREVRQHSPDLNPTRWRE
jgi:hypothetical protein